VPRANQLVAFEDALSQRPAAMQANVIHGGDGPIHVGNADDLITTRKFSGFAFRRKFGLGGELDEVGQGTLWHPEARSLKPIFAEC